MPVRWLLILKLQYEIKVLDTFDPWHNLTLIQHYWFLSMNYLYFIESSMFKIQIIFVIWTYFDIIMCTIYTQVPCSECLCLYTLTTILILLVSNFLKKYLYERQKGR